MDIEYARNLVGHILAWEAGTTVVIVVVVVFRIKMLGYSSKEKFALC